MTDTLAVSRRAWGIHTTILLALLFIACRSAIAQPRDGDENRSSVGTGFFVSDDGHIVTALHVVDGRPQVLVGPVSGNRWAVAKVVHTDPHRDLALLQSTMRRPALQVADWTKVPLGLEAIVIGYPQPRLLGFGKKVTQGIVNGERRRAARPGTFQLSAEVQRGNSGGPVLAPDGSVIGVVQRKLNALAVAEKTRDLPQNVNYALNSSELKAFLDEAGVVAAYRAPDLAAAPRTWQLYLERESSVIAVLARDPSRSGDKRPASDGDAVTSAQPAD